MPKAQSTMAPTSVYDPVDTRLNAEKKAAIETAVDQALVAALADRQNLELKLTYWNQLYEQDIGEQDSPWADAANFFVPIVPTFVDTVVDQLAAMVMVQRFWVVTGNDLDASKVAPDVERFYNNLMWRQDWDDALYDVLGLAARDGTGIMEVIWDRSEHMEKRLRQVPRVISTPFGDIPSTDNSGNVEIDTVEETIKITDYNNVRLNPVELRDFLFIPQWSKGVEQAPAVARAVYLNEGDLKRMVEAGELFKEETERAIRYTSTTSSDLAQDDVSTDTYQAAGSIQIGAEQGSLTSGDLYTPTARILKMWRVHTRQFDLNNDGIPEENVLWYHQASKTFCGYFQFPYAVAKRPFFLLRLLPRFQRALGFSIPERLQFTQVEQNALRNSRQNAIDLRMFPPFFTKSNVKLLTDGNEWGPGAKYEVDDEHDFGIIQLPQLPPEVWEAGKEYMQDAQMIMGFASPTSGQLSRERRSKFEMQVAAQGTSIRLGRMAQNFRSFCKKVINYVNALQIQYGPEEYSFAIQTAPGAQTRQVTVTKSMLSMDLAFNVSGSTTGPDKGERQQKALFVYQSLGQDPDVVSNPQHKYALMRYLLESYEVDNVIDLIGTEEEFIQQRQQMMQQAQQQQMMQQGGGGGPATPGAKPPLG